MGHDVFISYSSKDNKSADATCAFLESNGIRCWIAPRDIVPGLTWGDGIIEGITNSRAMVLLFSAHSNISEQVKREVERAVSKGIPIIPLRIDNTLPSKSMEYYISSVHWLDALTPPLERHLRVLANVLKSILSSQELGRTHSHTTPEIDPVRSGRRRLIAIASISTALVVVASVIYFMPPGKPAAGGPHQANQGPDAQASGNGPEDFILNQAILSKLEWPISMSFANETPLEDVLKYIKSATEGPNDSGIPIYVDPVGLQEVEKTMTSPVSIDIEGVPLKTSLKHLLAPLGLAYKVSGGLLVISSEQNLKR